MDLSCGQAEALFSRNDFHQSSLSEMDTPRDTPFVTNDAAMPYLLAIQVLWLTVENLFNQLQSLSAKSIEDYILQFQDHLTEAPENAKHILPAKSLQKYTSIISEDVVGGVAVLQQVLNAYLTLNTSKIPSQAAKLRMTTTTLARALAQILSCAASCGVSNATDVLREVGADVEMIDEHGNTPLMWASACGDLPAVTALTTKVNLDTRTPRGQTALFLACIEGHADIVATLIQAGASVDVLDNTRLTALAAAVELQREGVVRVLIAAKSDVNLASIQRSAPLIKALVCKNKTIVRMLIDAKANVEAKLAAQPALVTAVNDSDAELVQMLIDARANLEAPDGSRGTALLAAVRLKCVEALKVLVNAGANVNACNDEGQTPLIVAINECDPVLLKTLLDANADVDLQDEEGESALMYSAGCSDLAILQLILSKTADVNAVDSCGETALMRAVQSGTAEGMQALIDAKADVDIRDADGNTALHKTVNVSLAKAKLAIMAGADVNACNERGETPLMALCGGTMETECLVASTMRFLSGMLNLLLEAKADVNHKDVSGRSALLCVARLGLAPLTDMLLKAKADVNCVSDRGKTALMVASDAGHSDIVRLLADAGAVLTETS